MISATYLSVTVQQKRTLKVEKLARIYDDEIAPVWGSRFGKMLLRNLAVPERGQVLDISCGTGYPTIEILRRMTEGSRLIAIDASSAMLDVARRKIADLGPLGKKGVFFRTESAVPKLSFADDVYDLVVCNLGLGEMPSLEVALRDFARVTKRGGEVRCTLALAGTFQEFHDLYREVLIKHDKHEALDRLDRHIARYPSIDHVERCMRSASLAGGRSEERRVGKECRTRWATRQEQKNTETPKSVSIPMTEETPRRRSNDQRESIGRD